ncbi:Tn3 family transposase [Sorangium sp. So ce327]|uniref:Tn3 family transposase n=1 Tax=Sorangium sp. So ce327 TaxID=3133301 RepID=UPI003F5EE69C
MLRCLHEADIRDRVHLQLNRGESRHELARRLFFANQRAFRIGDHEETKSSKSASAPPGYRRVRAPCAHLAARARPCDP